MKQILHTPEGVRDIYNAECAKKLVVRRTVHKVLKLYGYHDIATPTFEYADVFGRDVGSISSKELYKFFDRDGNTLVLRPDITPSIARASSTLYSDEDMPLKLCYTGQTFINHSSYQGRLKETTQIGAELIGEDSAMADAEMIVMVIDAMKKSGLKEFQVSIGQVNFYRSLVQAAGIDEETEEQLRTLISNKNYFGVDTLLSKQDIDESLKLLISRLPELFGTVEILEEAKKLTSLPEAIEAIERLEEVYEVLKLYGEEKYASFDLGMTGNYMYYTGVIFRAYTFGTGDAIVKGGRYDNLLRSFGKDAPAIGFAIVVDELMSALNRQKIDIPYTKNNTLLLFHPTEQKLAIELAKEFREKGMNVELMAFVKGKTVEDYKAFGKRQHLGGILYLEDGQQVAVINLEKDAEQIVNIQQLKQSF